tara:strand:+ start:232 stop:462 length:231 start_codon:yes stop_codon:yes gene_type:complete
MNNTAFNGGAVFFCIIVTIAFIQSVMALLEMLQEGVLINEKDLLMTKTKKELKALLGDRRGISQLNKLELIDLLVS